LLVASAVLFIASACELNPVATEDDQPIEPGSSVFTFLRIQQNIEEALNVVFVPDGSYGDLSVLANRQAFLDDLADVVDTGFWNNESFVVNFHLFNYYYMTATGTVAPPTGGGICPTVTWPDEVDTDAAFADVILLIHSNELRDCAFGGGRATTEPTSFRTIVHESSHALFALPDEYCCDGGYREVKPVLYDSENECNNDPNNAAWRDCDSFTADDGTVWTRSEDTRDDIMSVGGDVVLEYGPADWVVVKDVLDNLGTVNTPSTFAPDNWDRP
jgi:hypothetical protein